MGINPPAVQSRVSHVHGHAEALKRQLAPDFVDHRAPAGMPPGPEAVLRSFEAVHQAFPDLRVKVEDIVAEGDRVAVSASWTGTHRGTFAPCCR